MSQLFDYFACTRPLIERWAEALANRDEGLQDRLRVQMPRFLTLKNIGQDEFNLLAACVAGDTVDVVEAVGQVDLVRAVTEEGPWVMAFRRPAIEAVAGLRAGEPLLRRWVRSVVELHGGDVGHFGKFLTVEAAGLLKEVCGQAVKEGLGVFVCFYG